MGVLSAAAHAALHGPFYAIAKSQLESSIPLDSQWLWEFWTRPRSPLVRSLAENYPPKFIADYLILQVPRSKTIAHIKEHYDISPDFFMLILDADYHFYSCADYEDPNESLETAQRRKAEHFLGLLEPQANHRILELGCGWGSMLRFLTDRLGRDLDIRGITISKAQAGFIRDNWNLPVSVEDFTQLELEPEAYDRIYSMGAWEHIRPREIAPLLEKLFAALKPGGRMVHQYSTLLKAGTPATYLLGDLIFSGFKLLTLEEQVAAARRVGFELTHDATRDYRPTWKAWYDNLARNADRAIQLAGPAEYNKYLLLFLFAWLFSEYGYAEIHRLRFEKPH